MSVSGIPCYYHRDYGRDLSLSKSQEIDVSFMGRCRRVGVAALPFVGLYKPLASLLSLTMGGIRSATALKGLYSAWEHPSSSALFCGGCKAILAVAALGATLYALPLGMLVTTGEDVLLDVVACVVDLFQGNVWRAAEGGISLISNAFYFTVLLGGGPECIIASLAMHALLSLYQSRKEWARGGWIEASGHLLLACVRGHQLIRVGQALYASKERQKAREERRPYLPLANGAQKMLVRTAYRMNGMMRNVIRRTGALLLSPSPSQGLYNVALRVQTAAGIALAMPLAFSLSVLSAPVYLLASYAGVGRFERIESSCPSPAITEEGIKVLFQNICGQNPWSLFSGGVPPPLELDPQGNTRVGAICERILENNPDIYCGQEFDDLDTSQTVAQTLSARGYTCIRDLGCNDPVLNHSGLFVAFRGSADFVAFHPFSPEDVSGITSWCQRGVLEVNLPTLSGRSLKVVNLHLNSGGEADQMARLTQLRKYVSPLLLGQFSLAVGDANLDTSRLSDAQLESCGLSAAYNALSGQVTCSDEGKHILNGKSREGCLECQECIDVALFDPHQLVSSELQVTPGNSDHSQISLVVTPAF